MDTSEKSKRAKARWSILRNALLQSARTTSSTSTTAGTSGTNTAASTTKAEKQDKITSLSSSSSNNDTKYSIHRFQGFQILNRKVVTHNDYNTNSNTNAEEDDFELIEYEIPIGNNNNDNNNDNSNNNDNNDHTRTHASSISISTSKQKNILKIQTKEKKQGQNKNKKINIKDLMSHVHYGVDNTGNTRVWECSTILAHLVTCQSPLLLPSSSMSSTPSKPSKPSTPLSTLSSNNCDNIPLPFIGLSNMISLAHPRPSAHPYQNVNTIPNTIQQKKYQENDSSPPLNNRLRIIELGSGMAALPSLSLAAVAMNNHTNTNISSNINTGRNTSTTTRTTNVPFMDIVITDGHPKSVENNSICSKLTHDLYYSNDNKDDNNNKDKEVEDKEGKKQNISSELCCYCCSIQTKLLLWKANEEGMKECQALLKNDNNNNNNNNDHNSDSNSDTEPNYFDVVLVSDCTHFIEFHSGLIATIGRLLRVGGVCILCQPKRGKSLDQFIELIHTMNHSCNRDGDGDVNVHKNDNDNCTHNDIATAATATASATPTKPLFELNLYNDYNERISNQHKEYLERKDDTYDENIHYPLILILRKLREYNEDIDTKIALHHVEQRDAGRI